jgi:hypothetical protein
MKLLIISIPSPSENTMPLEVLSILETIRTVLNNIDLVLFEKGILFKGSDCKAEQHSGPISDICAE